jgi:hypothetical protein
MSFPQFEQVYHVSLVEKISAARIVPIVATIAQFRARDHHFGITRFYPSGSRAGKRRIAQPV